ncbi:D-glycero-beta-D-manno-heptose-7-phosphate kinase [Brumimicrobium salinarum]|uniref:D-glycero-beta-D-manno-heptose-7-phosphate kinase n=1 Tax=Brumimicrobium salinarum TaxID=2058658 RepID=A0A2I0R2V8_9FLAO|nr:PfkB family carbohydrate kinase [Brumimicrobium salinarum]PKR80907.1 D-glycero-beta-D-manno-heptose-7-phosphate kinase [Brumimicrobium salinarum]
MTLETLFEAFKQKKIIVLGDVMIDAYLSGKVDRVSPEAPVPIINFSKHEERLGGAANVALNLISLGAQVAMASVIGNDKNANALIQLFEEKSINTTGLIRSDDRETTVKTRVLGNYQQLLRIDQEQTDDINLEQEKQLLNQIESLLKQGYDALIFQDYNKGVLTESLIKQVIELTEKYDVITTVDPKLKNFLAYEGVTLFKPNLKELAEGVQMKIDFEKDRPQFNQAIKKLKKTLNPAIIFVTLSEHGVYIEDNKESQHIEAHARTISDVSGAGDTVISVATLCLVAGMKVSRLASMANLAGGIVCEYRGVVAIKADELFKEAKKLNV